MGSSDAMCISLRVLCIQPPRPLARLDREVVYLNAKEARFIQAHCPIRNIFPCRQLHTVILCYCIRNRSIENKVGQRQWGLLCSDEYVRENWQKLLYR